MRPTLLNLGRVGVRSYEVRMHHDRPPHPRHPACRQGEVMIAVAICGRSPTVLRKSESDSLLFV